MNFNSLTYLLFLPITVILYFVLPKRLKNPALLLASYFFYACWQPAYALLMLFSTAATYFCGRLLQRYKSKKRLWLVLCLVVNLAILFFFKYFNFFSTLAFGKGALTLNVLLPVGISFYTFQAIGYTIDVYRGDIAAEKNFCNYALFVSFFPQLVAGPIERTGNILPQLKVSSKFSLDNLNKGLILIVWGMFKKVVIADNAAVTVNAVYDSVKDMGALSLVIATLMFAVQIYCDFSAYSDIARGSAKIIGIDLMQNFKSPYLAVSIKDFWRRWHISLSSWFKDYLYFPLGGSRVKKPRLILNLLIVFMVSGLWHGAALTFVVWGLLHGLYQAAEIFTEPFFKNKKGLCLRIARTGFTFLLVNVGWVFFRANTLLDALTALKKIFTLGDGQLLLGQSSKMVLVTLVAAVVMFIVEAFNQSERVFEFIKSNIFVRYAFYFVILIVIFVFGYYGDGFDPQDFVYFQF